MNNILRGGKIETSKPGMNTAMVRSRGASPSQSDALYHPDTELEYSSFNFIVSSDITIQENTPIILKKFSVPPNGPFSTINNWDLYNGLYTCSVSESLCISISLTLCGIFDRCSVKFQYLKCGYPAVITVKENILPSSAVDVATFEVSGTLQLYQGDAIKIIIESDKPLLLKGGVLSGISGYRSSI